MQNKGFVKAFAILLTLVCVFYLSFSFVTRHYTNKAREIANGDPRVEQSYLDSLANEKVWLWNWSLKDCREMEIGLGLDLKGGMNVILEVSVPDVIKALADNKSDETFNQALATAAQQATTSQDDVITLFIREYHRLAPDAPLAQLFATQQLKDKVNQKSTDAEVEKVLREEVKAAVDNSYNVLRTRIDRFGVVQPNIQSLEDKMGRIMVELPGIKEPERVRKLLQGSANLEFWETYNANEIAPYMQSADAKLRSLLARRRYDSRVRESRAAVCAQYGQLAQVLDRAAGRLDQHPPVDARRQRLMVQRMKALGIRGKCSVTQDPNGHVHIQLEGPEVERLVQGGELAKLSTLLGCPLRQDTAAPRGQVVLVQQEPLVAVAGLAAADRKGQSVSGDCGAWFKDEAGRLNFLLCDGMGSGPAAREDSNCALGLLEKFLRAGLEVEAALATVGEALALRGEAQGGFTTVDLFQLDLFSGRSAVYKLGAAPTYFRKPGGVERVVGRSMPAGVAPGMKADSFPQQLGAGDWVVLVSDGVVSPREDSWLRRLLADYEGSSPQELAARILQESGQREGEEDDRTVMVIRLDVRPREGA